MRVFRSVFDALAKHHISTTLTINESASGGSLLYALGKMRGSGKLLTVQFWIASRKIYGVAALRWCLIGKRRKEADLCTAPPPAIEQMQIRESESIVAGDRNRDRIDVAGPLASRDDAAP